MSWNWSQIRHNGAGARCAGSNLEALEDRSRFPDALQRITSVLRCVRGTSVPCDEERYANRSVAHP